MGEECPRCKKVVERLLTLSRRDNKTNICDSCGRDEALFDYAINDAKTKEMEIDKEVISKEKAWLIGGK